jgi:hypothetical protein
MNITIERKEYKDYTAGSLFIDNIFECYTLEDTVRNVKIAGETAIPYGAYEVIITYSNRFKKSLPLLLNVPNFEGVRIHAGNTVENTEGCILVGLDNGSDGFLGDSRSAMARIMPIIEDAIKSGENVMLEIKKQYKA